ncbi:hypothetical protein [Sangeribacter muris]|uniref:hypothetical protein n=1 Tax=Sangeribacter muris TaxID=2880703 RepID=UPI00244E2D4C|nr:hypothetical protein [Sangeribacter muris]
MGFGFRAEPVKVRQQLGEGQRRNFKKEFSSFEKVSPTIQTADNLCAAPLEQAKGLDLICRELVGEKLINVT